MSMRPLKRFILHVPLISVILNARPVPKIGPDRLQMKIAGHHAGIQVGRRVRIVARCVKGPVVHDVIKINSNAKTVRHLDDLQQLRPGAPAGRNRAALVFVSEIKRVERIITHRINTAAFGGRRQPEAVIAGFGNLRHLLNQLVPVHVEEFEHRLAPGDSRAPEQKNEEETRPKLREP